MKNYKPNPIDTTGVAVPETLIKLSDTLARNVHETWAKERISQGWKYGAERNDKEKLHPCLVPFDDLPENEKIFDHNTAMETIKVILKSGYSLNRKSEYVEKDNARYFVESIRSRFHGKKNLVYFASGTDLINIKEFYTTEKFDDFDNIVLVDFSHRVNAIIGSEEIVYWNIFVRGDSMKQFSSVKHFGKQVNEINEVKGRIICLRAHAIDAINLFYEFDIKFDYFTVVNEGWVQFPALNNHGFIGYALQVLKDSFYCYTEDKYFDKYVRKLPYAKIQKIEDTAPEYIEVCSESDNIRTSLYYVSQPLKTRLKAIIGNVSVFLVNKSIWQERNELDYIIYSLRSTRLQDRSVWEVIQDSLGNIEYIEKSEVDEFLEALTDADYKEKKIIGLIPLGQHKKYNELLEIIENKSFKNIKEIRFYHIDPKDFDDIKGQFEQA